MKEIAHWVGYYSALAPREMESGIACWSVVCHTRMLPFPEPEDGAEGPTEEYSFHCCEGY